jgi:hypothetical protein
MSSTNNNAKKIQIIEMFAFKIIFQQALFIKEINHL